MSRRQVQQASVRIPSANITTTEVTNQIYSQFLCISIPIIKYKFSFCRLLASTEHEENWQNPVWLILLYSSCNVPTHRLFSKALLTFSTSPDLMNTANPVSSSSRRLPVLYVFALQGSNYYASATLLNSYPSSSSRSVDREGGFAICT